MRHSCILKYSRKGRATEIRRINTNNDAPIIAIVKRSARGTPRLFTAPDQSLTRGEVAGIAALMAGWLSR